MEIDDQVLIDLFDKIAFHQVSFHELLGHGCGKMFTEREDGTLNFSADLKDPYRGGPIGYYKKGETWNTVFKDLSNNMEECRADAVALYFSCVPEAITILQPELKGQEETLCYAMFLQFVKMAVDSLQFYDTDEQRWMQAHCNGRYVILRVLLDAAPDFVTIKIVEAEGKKKLRLAVDRSQILTTGKKAIAEFLFKLNALKATANVEHSRPWFGHLSTLTK
jgi:dipeptidyl-peptidase-3